MAQVKVQFNRGVEGATNIVDAGTEGTKAASGTTAQRGTTGQLDLILLLEALKEDGS